jgi:hypothetical protein
VALLELSATHRAAWEHAEETVRSGEQAGFKRAFGCPIFEYCLKG